MLPDQREIYYQIMSHHQERLREREQDRLRRLALEARRQKTPRRSFSLLRWLRRMLPNGAPPADEMTLAHRPVKEGSLS